MLRQISLLILCAAAIVLFATPVQACTSAVVSGKVTPDGRPLLWKNRDTDFMQNHIDYLEAASGVSRVAEYVAWRHPVRIAG